MTDTAAEISDFDVYTASGGADPQTGAGAAAARENTGSAGVVTYDSLNNVLDDTQKSVTGIVLDSAGTNPAQMAVYSEGTAENTVVNSGGFMLVNRGYAENTTVNSGGTLSVYSGSLVENITLNGGFLELDEGVQLKGNIMIRSAWTVTGALEFDSPATVFILDLSGMAGPAENPLIYNADLMDADLPDFTVQMADSPADGLYALYRTQERVNKDSLSVLTLKTGSSTFYLSQADELVTLEDTAYKMLFNGNTVSLSVGTADKYDKVDGGNEILENATDLGVISSDVTVADLSVGFAYDKDFLKFTLDAETFVTVAGTGSEETLYAELYVKVVLGNGTEEWQCAGNADFKDGKYSVNGGERLAPGEYILCVKGNSETDAAVNPYSVSFERRTGIELTDNDKPAVYTGQKLTENLVLDVYADGKVSDPVLDGGTLNIRYNGKAENLTGFNGAFTVMDGGLLEGGLLSGDTVSNTCVSGGIQSGGIAKNITLENGASLLVQSGGILENASVSSGSLYFFGGTCDGVISVSGSGFLEISGIAFADKDARIELDFRDRDQNERNTALISAGSTVGSLGLCIRVDAVPPAEAFYYLISSDYTGTFTGSIQLYTGNSTECAGTITAENSLLIGETEYSVKKLDKESGNLYLYVGPETTPPTAPSNLKYDRKTNIFSWKPSVDNIGVAGYKVVLSSDSGAVFTFDVAGGENQCELPYSCVNGVFNVSLSAYDKAGNTSPKISTEITITGSRYQKVDIRTQQYILFASAGGKNVLKIENTDMYFERITVVNAPQKITGPGGYVSPNKPLTGATRFQIDDNLSVNIVFLQPGMMKKGSSSVKKTWQAGFSAQYQNTDPEREQLNESVALAGKNRFQDVVAASDNTPENTGTMKTILYLTDDANGDALILDDLFSLSPGEPESRLAGVDEIFAGAGNDVVDLTSSRFTENDSIRIHGGAGHDVIWSGDGANILFGDAGNDRIIGGSGDDVLSGGSGNDVLHGGGGSDIFCFGGNWGNDTVQQFTGAGNSVTLYFDFARSEVNWNETVLTYSRNGNSVTVTGVEKVTLVFNDDAAWRQDLADIGCFADATGWNVFEDKEHLELAVPPQLK